MNASLVYVADLNYGGQQRRPQDAAAFYAALQLLADGETPKGAIPAKEDPKMLDFVQAVFRRLPTAPQIKSGQHDSDSFHPYGQTIWWDGDDERLGQRCLGDFIWIMPGLKDDDHGLDYLLQIALPVVVSEASARGLSVFLCWEFNEENGTGFLPDETIVGLGDDIDPVHFFSRPEFLSEEELEQNLVHGGLIPLKRAEQRVLKGVEQRLIPLGFEVTATRSETGFNINCRRLIEGGEQTWYLGVRRERSSTVLVCQNFRGSFSEVTTIVEHYGKKGGGHIEYGKDFSDFFSEEETANILEKTNSRHITDEFPGDTESQFQVFEAYCLKLLIPRAVQWLDKVRSLENLYQEHISKLHDDYKTNPFSLVCMYLLSAPEYEKYRIKSLLAESSDTEYTYQLITNLDTHVTPHNGIKPEYRISVPMDDPIPTPAPPVLPVLTEERYGLNMVVLPAGSFDRHWERSTQQVHVPSFALGMYPVTQQQWEAVMGHNPSFFKGANRPVEFITWQDAQAFIAKLNEQTGQTYRLPSEAEWEYACKAGTTGKWYFGEDESLLQDHAWYADNSDLRTHPVGQKQPNPFGLYDMLGNVWEWCQDGWGEYYRDAPPADGSARPAGIKREHEFYWGNCVVRGGSCAQAANRVTSVWRGHKCAFFVNSAYPLYRNINLGLRLAMTLK